MRIIHVIEKIEQILISVLFSIMVLAVFSQVVNRNLLKLEISWFEEVARCCMVYVLMFATEIGLRDRSQLNIDSLTRRLPAGAAKVMEYISTAVVIVFSGIVGFSSIQILKTQASTKAVTAALGMPTYIPQAAVTIGCILISATQCIVVVNTILHRGEEGASK